MTFDPFAPSGKPDFKRNGRAQPLVVPAGGGEAKPYTRASGVAYVLDDPYSLHNWKRGNVAFGVARDPSLTARLIAVGGNTPHDWDSEQRKAVQAIADQAEQVAQAHRGADVGSAVHKMVERLNQGETVDGGPYQADLDAYRQAVEQMGWRIDPALVECRMVCDELEAAGTCDMVVHDGERYRVADLKTGQSINYAILGYAAQLACYARSDLYDPTDDTRTQLNIDTEVGYLVHLPAGQGVCGVYRVDLEAGYKAARLAATVRRARTAAKGFAELILSVRADQSGEVAA